MSSLNPNDDQKWVPTHVQVTVLKGRGLRGKGKSGTSDVYTIIQLGKEKYSTCVVEKTTEPEWREECTFELQPGALDNGELVLTVMHRALIGLDVFLGQAVIPLDTVFTLSRGVKNEWYRLNSKTGKKEKERGDIQVTLQFSRNNLTASMYDLVMKDKGVSTFFKLKERIRGKRRSSEEDSSSAILPGGYGSLVRMRQRLPSDGGGEEYYEDDEGGEVRRSKMRTFFLRGKLRKSSDTRSSTSLGSESSESSSRGGSLSPTAGISVVVSDLSNSPSNSSNLTADNSPEHTANTSPKLSSPKCEFGDEAGEITIAVPQPKVCVNGSHSLSIQPLDSGKPAASLGLGLLKPLPLSMSLQNLSPRDTDLPRGIMGDGRRWSFDKPDEEEKAAIVAALEQSGPMLGDTEEESLGSNTTSSCITVVTDVQGKKKKALLSHARESTGKSSRDESEQAPDDRHRGWFGSKDCHSKPSHSLVVSPTDPHPPPFPWGCNLDPPLYHSNPFSPSQPSPPPLSPANPFFSVLHNPFYKDMLNVTPSLPPLPFLSSARPPITTLFPEAKSTIQSNTEATSGNAMAEDHLSNEHLPLSNKSSNPFTSKQELEAEWDQSFDEFAAGRLQSPEDLTTVRTTQQNTPRSHPLTLSIDKETTLLKTDGELTTNEELHSHPMLNSTCADSNTHHCFTKHLDTIPENSLEIDNKPFSESTQNTDVFNDSHCENSSQKFNSSSPDPTSSGLGSSAEEDGLSCFSSCSASDKLYASSSEETELHHCESSILVFEKPPVVKHLKTSESEEEGTDKSEDMSLDQLTVIEDYGKDVVSTLKTVQSPTTIKTDIEGSNAEDLNCNTDPNLKQDIDAFPNREHELSPTLPTVFVITSSPGHPDSPCAAEQDQLSPVPRALFNDFPNTSSITPSPDTSLLQTSNRSSFAQSLYMSADSQEYQTCLTHATSGLSEANSTLCKEEKCVQMANDTATDLDDFFNASRHSSEEVKPERQNVGLFGDLNRAIFETNFTPVDNFMIQRDLHPKHEVPVGDMFSKRESSGLFDDNFTDFVIQGGSHPKQEVMADNQSPNHLNGGEFGSNFTTMDNFMIRSDSQQKQEELPGEMFFRGLNGGLSDSVKFGSNFTVMDNFRLQSDLPPIKEELAGEMFGSDFTAVDHFTLQSSTEPKQEAVACDMFTTSLNGRPSDNVNGEKFGSNFTAVDNIYLQSDLQPIKEELTRDMFSSDQKGRLFDNVNDAESNFTAVGNFSLQSSPNPAQDAQEAHAEEMFSKGLNSGLFDGVYTVTFQSNFTTVDDFEIQSDSHTKQAAVADVLFPNYPNGGVTNNVNEINFDTSFPAVDDFTVKNDPHKQDVFVDDMFSKLHNSGVFDNEATFGSTFESNFASNFTTSDNFMMQRAPQSKPEALNDDILTRRLKAEHATLYRSQSEGTLTPAFDDLQSSAFGSDPGNIQESSTKPQPDLLLFSPFNPCLTPQCSSSPIPLCPLPPFADAAAATSTPGSSTCPAPATMAISQETSQEQTSANQLVSPHLVKPLTTATTVEEKKTESRSVLEKLKSTINPGRSIQSTEDGDKKKSLTEGAGTYYHLTHSELVSLLVQREAELGRQKVEFERQKTLLSKREAELKKLKPQVKDLEDYIDTLLVRIMEQKPTLLQVRSKFK